MSSGQATEDTNLQKSGVAVALFEAVAGAGAVALPASGGRCAYVDHLWNRDSGDSDASVRLGKKFYEIEVAGTGSFAVTLAKLYALRLRALEFADSAVTSIAGDVITRVAHGFKTGDGPIAWSGTTDAFDVTDRHYAIYLTDDTYSIATSRKNALEGTALTLTGTTEAVSAVDVVGVTKRVHQHLVGSLGPAYDGAITITATEGWSDVIQHSPRNIGYQVSASYTGTLSIDLYPLEDLTE